MASLHLASLLAACLALCCSGISIPSTSYHVGTKGSLGGTGKGAGRSLPGGRAAAATHRNDLAFSGLPLPLSARLVHHQGAAAVGRSQPARLRIGGVERRGRARLQGARDVRAAMQPLGQKDSLPMEAVAEGLQTGQIQDAETLSQLINKVTLPKHPRARFGELPNGLAYCILPNAAPAGRFECHLEVCAGSADELVSQQGMAHMCEHVSYMGSKKRERLFGTSSQTNAQTDFHHTVYWASCPTYRPSSGVPMLPLALDALCDVMEAKFEPSRVEKERSAILSEAAMVNTIDYRVEVQLLSALHEENRLKKRFPIGKVEQIKSWSNQEVKAYHAAHYRPNNAHLYVIGDIDTDEAEVLIQKTFSHLESRDPPVYPPEEEMVIPNLKNDNRFLPPVSHEWLGTRSHGTDKPRVHIFQHELMQSFSAHIFAKVPVEPIRTLADYREAMIRRIVVVALQIRLNVHARGKPIVMVEFSHLDSPREGCAVCALDLVVESDDWQNGLSIAVREFKRMTEHGISQMELQR